MVKLLKEAFWYVLAALIFITVSETARSSTFLGQFYFVWPEFQGEYVKPMFVIGFDALLIFASFRFAAWILNRVDRYIERDDTQNSLLDEIAAFVVFVFLTSICVSTSYVLVSPLAGWALNSPGPLLSFYGLVWGSLWLTDVNAFFLGSVVAVGLTIVIRGACCRWHYRRGEEQIASMI